MAKNETKKKNVFVKDSWQLLQMLLSICIIVLLILLTLEITEPIELENQTEGIFEPNFFKPVEASDLYAFSTGSIAIKPGLFKPETQLSDRPIADKTIQTIKSKLTLQCIMEKDGEPVAFIKVKGEGLKECFVGDSVGDMFTVLSIQKKSIKVSIVDHEVKLTL